MASDRESVQETLRAKIHLDKMPFFTAGGDHYSSFFHDGTALVIVAMNTSLAVTFVFLLCRDSDDGSISDAHATEGKGAKCSESGGFVVLSSSTCRTQRAYGSGCHLGGCRGKYLETANDDIRRSTSDTTGHQKGAYQAAKP